MTRLLGVSLLAPGCASEVLVEGDSGQVSPGPAAGAGGGGGRDGLTTSPETFCARQVAMRALRLGCDKHLDDYVRSCVEGLEHAERVGCTEETLALWDCAAMRSTRCTGITTGCNYEKGVWRRACYPMDDESGGGAP